MSSNIIVNVKYQHSFTIKKNIGKWLDYVSKKEKADSTSLDEKNLLSEYYSLMDQKSSLFEKCESFVWGQNGDINPKQEIKYNDFGASGFLWNFVVSFPPDFALNNGLVTKSDYFSLTKNIMPSLITDMGLKIDNVIWYASLHRNTDNPHLHILVFEKNKSINKGFVPRSVLYKMKSNIGNYLVDYSNFYKTRDNEFNNITGTISLKELNRVKGQKLFSDKYRKTLNQMLLDLYDKLPKVGRLQYNSKNLKPYKLELDNIINFILQHDSIKYQYANYLKLLEKHQQELISLYGNSTENINRKYYNDQLNRLYSKIGNEILNNFKRYNSMDLIAREKSFLEKHIKDINFKSRSDYAKDETKINIAKGLYKLCSLANLNNNETKKVFEKWLKNSKYNFNVDALISTSSSLSSELSSTEYYKILRSLGFNYDRYCLLKNKYFYQELNYKRFINNAINHLMYEKNIEEKQIIANMQYELEGYK